MNFKSLFLTPYIFFHDIFDKCLMEYHLRNSSLHKYATVETVRFPHQSVAKVSALVTAMVHLLCDVVSTVQGSKAQI